MVHRIKVGLGFVLATVLIFAFQNMGIAPTPYTPSQQPESFDLSQPGVLGAADPSLASAPGDNRIWMSYTSGALPEADYPYPADNKLSTRLAYSIDGGSTWKDSETEIFKSYSQVLPFPYQMGTWMYEVSNLVYDEGAPTGETWKIFSQRYLMSNGDRLGYMHSWIAAKFAGDPTDLAQAPEQKLITGSNYDNNDNYIVGRPKLKLNKMFKKIGRPLSDCIAFSEPGALSYNGALYLALGCYTGKTNDRIVLLRLSHQPETWSYIGVILSADDFIAAGIERYSASDLFVTGGGIHLAVSPEIINSENKSIYHGCQVFRFKNLEKAKLIREAPVAPQAIGKPKLFAQIPDIGGGNLNGACTYNQKATNSGVIFFMLDVFDQLPRIRLFKSFQNIN